MHSVSLFSRAARNLLFTAILLGSLLPGRAEPGANSPTPYRAGDTFVSFTAKDQHERDVTVSPAEGMRHLVVSFAMSTGRDANRYFEAKGAGWLEAHQAAFLADIHAMPGIGRTFALPKMRKYPHRVVLGDDDHLLDRYPKEKDKVTVFDFNADGTIAAIRFLDPASELDQLFP